jgi:hypothetical protein
MNKTQSPAARVPFIDERSGQISREWYLFLFHIKTGLDLVTASSFNVKQVSEDYILDNTTLYLICTGTITVTLQPHASRENILSITNAGTGRITIIPADGEFIQDDSSKELDFQWTTVQLCPIPGGYVII